VHKLLRGYRKCTYVPGMSCSYWYIYCCVLIDYIWANKWWWWVMVWVRLSFNVRGIRTMLRLGFGRVVPRNTGYALRGVCLRIVGPWRSTECPSSIVNCITACLVSSVFATPCIREWNMSGEWCGSVVVTGSRNACWPIVVCKFDYDDRSD